MGELRLRRRVEVQTNSTALPPSGAFVAYVDRGVVIDDGEKRWFRKRGRRLTKSDTEVVRGACDDGVVVTDGQHLKVVRLDASVIELMPVARHPAVQLDHATETLTTLLGTQVVQFDTRTWQRRRTFDLSRDLDISEYTFVFASPQWVVVTTTGRWVVLDGDGEVETILPARRRWAPVVVGDRLIAQRVTDTLVTTLPHDDDLDLWDGETNPTWCSVAGELRTVAGGDVVVRRDGSATRYTAPQAGHTTYVDFADSARMVIRRQIHAKQFDIYEW